MNYTQEAFTLHFKGITTNVLRREIDFRKIPENELRENGINLENDYFNNELAKYTDDQLKHICLELDAIESDIQYNNIVSQEPEIEI